MFVHYHIYIDSIPTVNPGHIFGARAYIQKDIWISLQGAIFGVLRYCISSAKKSIKISQSMNKTNYLDLNGELCIQAQ